MFLNIKKLHKTNGLSSIFLKFNLKCCDKERIDNLQNESTSTSDSSEVCEILALI